jgi:peptide/nickel transport system ATP-binding protein
MYLGHVVEIANTFDLYKNPLHPYTKALISAIPIPDPIIESQRQRMILEGEVPSPVNPPSGCVFRTRCPIADKTCSETTPVLKKISENQHVACLKVS